MGGFKQPVPSKSQNTLLTNPYVIILHTNLSTFTRNMQIQAVVPLNYNHSVPFRVSPWT